MRVAAVLDVGRRNPQAARWALEAMPPAAGAEQCWVEFAPGAYEGGLASLPAWFTAGDDPPVARPYIGRDEFTRDPAAEFAARPQRHGWALGGLLVGVVGWLMTWFRRSELGLYLALGTTRPAMMFLLALEGWLLIGAAWLVALAYAIAIAAARDALPGLAAAVLATRTSGLAALLAVALLPLGSLLLVRGNVAELLKDR